MNVAVSVVSALLAATPASVQRIGFVLGPAQGFPLEHTNVVLVESALNAPAVLATGSRENRLTGTFVEARSATLFSRPQPGLESLVTL